MMKQLKSFLKSRTIGFYIQTGTMISLIIAIIFYGIYGVNEYAQSYDYSVFISSILSIALSIVSLFLELKIIRECSFIISLYALISYIGSQANYIASILVSIDGTKLSSHFLIPTIFYILSFISGVISVFFSNKKEDEVFVIETKTENHPKGE